MKKKILMVALVPLVVALMAGVAYQGLSGRSIDSAKVPKACSDGCENEKVLEGKSAVHENHESEDHTAEDAGHGEHGHGEEKLVVLTDKQMKDSGVEVATAGPGRIDVHLALTGEIAINADRMAHIVPRVSGVVREVRKNLGDVVKKGEILAVLESRELADAKAGYLAARERLAMTQMNFDREEQLWKKKISTEQEYLQTKQLLAEAKIELRSSEQKLHALGLSESDLTQLPQLEHLSLTQYEMIVPFDATIIEKHLTLGEAVKDDSEVFTIADLSTVWATFNLHQKDMARVKKGQPVVVSDGSEGFYDNGTISFIAPLVGEQTRTTPVRVVLVNPDGRWRPGLFVVGQVRIDSVTVPVRVTRDAIQQIEGKPCIFVKVKEGFEPQPVTVGRINDVDAEILSGLSAGQVYVAKGAYTLKLELGKFKGDPCGGH